MFGAAEEDDADFLAPGGGWVTGSGLRRLGTAGTTGTGGLGAGGSVPGAVTVTLG